MLHIWKFYLHVAWDYGKCSRYSIDGASLSLLKAVVEKKSCRPCLPEEWQMPVCCTTTVWRELVGDDSVGVEVVVSTMLWTNSTWNWMVGRRIFPFGLKGLFSGCKLLFLGERNKKKHRKKRPWFRSRSCSDLPNQELQVSHLWLKLKSS